MHYIQSNIDDKKSVFVLKLGPNLLILLHLLSLALLYYCIYFCEGYENPAHILSQLDI